MRMYIYDLWIYIKNGGWCRACPVGDVLVKIIDEEKTGCNKTELLEQLRSTILDTLRLKHCHHTDEHKKLSLLELWKDLLEGHAQNTLGFVNLSSLMIATSPNTSNLERAYSKLETITIKHRNHLKIDNLETLFVLANLQIPMKPPLQYENKVVHLEENN